MTHSFVVNQRNGSCVGIGRITDGAAVEFLHLLDYLVEYNAS